MKTKLLRKWRKAAWYRIGVFKQKDGKYRVVFDRSVIGNVSEYDESDSYDSFQVLVKDIEDFSAAVEECNHFRRQFILRLVAERKYGTANRMY